MLVFHVAFLVLVVGSAALFSGLDLLNLRHAARTVRAESAWVRDQLGADPERILSYQRVKTGFSLLQSWVGLGILLLVLYGGIYADVVALTESVGDSLLAGFAPRTVDWLTGVGFFVALALVLRVASLPFDAVDTFVVEDLFDFNNQSPRLWLRDVAVGTVVLVALTAVVGSVLLAVVQRFPTWWWAAGAALFLAFALVMQVVYPRVIAPLFYDFDPVESGDLREAVDDVFDRAGFDCEQVYVMDASSRSSHSNAYFVGFGRTKRVVLFDTLVDDMGTEELQSVLAHELAHWKRAHIWKQLAVGTLQTAAVLFVLQYLLSTPWLYGMFGVPEATYAGLVVAVLWVSPLNDLVAPLSNQLSLAHEREADDFATRVMGDGEPLAGALSTLVSENLGNPFPHPWYAAFHYTHPPVPERIRRVRDRSAKTAGETGGETSV